MIQYKMATAAKQYLRDKESTNSHKNRLRVWIIIILSVIGGLALFGILVYLIYYIYQRRSDKFEPPYDIANKGQTSLFDGVDRKDLFGEIVNHQDWNSQNPLKYKTKTGLLSVTKEVLPSGEFYKISRHGHVDYEIPANMLKYI